MSDPSSIFLIVFLSLLGIHLIPVIIKSIGILTWKNKRADKRAEPISVIVCARNEENNLKELVPVLLNQDHPEFEVIIVLDRCFDESLAYLKSLENQYSNLKTLIVDYVPDQFHPKKFGLTLAIKGAKNDLVLLTDADCRPTSENWVLRFSQQFDDNIDFVLGFGPYLQEKSFLNHFIQYETFTTGFEYLSFTRLGLPYMAVGRNLAYRKSKFLENKGFNVYQGITGGDDDLLIQQMANSQNTKILIGSDTNTISKPKKNWKEYWAQKRRHLSVGKFYKKHSIVRHLIKSQIHLWLWVSFITLAILNIAPHVIWPAFVGLIALKGVFYWRSAQKMGQGYQFWITPILDFTYAFFIPVVGTVAFFRKNIPWK